MFSIYRDIDMNHPKRMEHRVVVAMLAPEIEFHRAQGNLALEGGVGPVRPGQRTERMGLKPLLDLHAPGPLGPGYLTRSAIEHWEESSAFTQPGLQVGVMAAPRLSSAATQFVQFKK